MSDSGLHIPCPTHSRRRFLTGAAATAATIAVGPTFFTKPAGAAAPPAGVRLAYGSDPRTSMTVSWSTPDSVAAPRVRVGPTGSVDLVVDAETRTSIDSTMRHHHATITGLDPATTYDYVIEMAGVPDVSRRLSTVPVEGPIRFTAFGDQGDEPNKTGPINDVINGFDAHFHFHVGDISYASGSGGVAALEAVEAATGGLNDSARWDSWQQRIEDAASLRPWMTVVGNHEMDPTGSELGYDAYFARLNTPGNGASGPVVTTWSQTYGNLAIVALDGNDASYEIPRNLDYLGGEQERWLRSTLQTLRADPAIDWIVVGFHHCAYCSSFRHGSDGGVRDQWVPLFEEFGVDLVINGHNHLYERTHPVRAGAPTTELPVGGEISDAGPVYVTSGIADEDETIPDRATPGVSTVTEFTGTDFGVRVPELAPWSAVVVELAPIVVTVEVTPPDAGGRTTLAVRSVNAADRSAVDSFTLTRTRTPPVEDLGGEPVETDAGSAAPTAEAASPGGSLPATGGGALAAGAVAAAAAGLAVRRAAAGTPDDTSA